MSNVVCLCLLTKKDDDIPRSMSSDSVCYPRVMMTCNARRHLIVCAAQGQLCHTILNLIRPFRFFKGDDSMPCASSPTVCIVKERDGMPHPTLSDHVCCARAKIAGQSDCVCSPRSIKACHAQCRLSVSAALWR